MKRIIILEGPDNIGKSYLADYLHERITTPVIVRHFGPPEKKGHKVLQEQLRVLRREAMGIDDGRDIEIWDRSVIGEEVYGPMYRTGRYNHTEYHVELSYELRKRARQIFFVVLYTDGEIFKRLKIKPKTDEDMVYKKQTEAMNVARAFVNVATNLRLKNTLFVNCANYETFDDRNNYITRRVQAWLKLKRYRYDMAEDYSQTFFNAKSMLWKPEVGFVRRPYECNAFDNKTCMIGRDHRKHSEYGQDYGVPTSACGAIRNVDFIFVGEAPGHKGCGKLGIPFFGDMSGNLLQEALDSCGIFPTRYYMTNVVKCCPKDNKVHEYGDVQALTCTQQLKTELEGIMKKNPEAGVIALGKVAAAELAKLRVEHKMMYHPAYFLRTGTGDNFITDFRKVVDACR